MKQLWRRLRGWAADLADGVVPLLAKEIRGRSRRTGYMVLLTFYLLALAGGITLMLGLAVESGYQTPDTGLLLFSGLVVGFVVLLAFIAPALTVGAVSGERERKTLDLLLVTRASSLGIALGKLLSSVVHVIYLLLASIPAFALVYLYGGVPISYIGLALLAAGVTALTFASLGLFVSALIRRTQVAAVVSYLLVLLLVFGLPVLGIIQRETAGPPAPGQRWTVSLYASASPLVGAGAAFSGPEGEGLPILGELVRALTEPPPQYDQVMITRPAPGGGTVTTVSGHVSASNPAARPDPPHPWRLYLLYSLALTSLAVAGAALRLGGGGDLRAFLLRRPRREVAP